MFSRKAFLVARRFVYAKLSPGSSRVPKTSAPITKYSMTPMSRARRVVHRIFSPSKPPAPPGLEGQRSQARLSARMHRAAAGGKQEGPSERCRVCERGNKQVFLEG